MIEFSKLFPALATDLPAGARNDYRGATDNSMLDPSNRLMNGDSETFAIHAAQNGSEQAWRQLFERHFDALYRFCVALAGARHDLAEEVAQQVFVVAARRIHRFDPSRATFRAWLLGIARNRHMAIRTSQQRRKQYEKSSANGSSEAVTRADPDLRVHEALARLPSHYRTVLEAKYLRGLSMKDIAADSGATIEAIESSLRRARAGFARVYEQIRTSE
ncbi:MAG: sigma-70 family RNA polymerase sigma factor [Phycisphaerales bacterium]|nr:MAG: sigma-70 family RNA polymerase sigma factor [Phycisphaerales bacterium]